jgi:hypothetical protein
VLAHAAGTCALELAYHCGGALSTEQEIPDTPLGPAPAVAVTYWVPAVLGASVGPESEIVGVWLSTSTVLL